jgi:hypothetical protein
MGGFVERKTEQEDHIRRQTFCDALGCQIAQVSSQRTRDGSTDIPGIFSRADSVFVLMMRGNLVDPVTAF